jgi:energy-coupling factor transporter ATP-binding protein EcfA2
MSVAPSPNQSGDVPPAAHPQPKPQSSALPVAAMTLAEVLSLPGPKRLAWVENVRVLYPLWEQILQIMQDAHELNPHAAEPQCLMVTGPTGAGKSTLVDSYAARYPAAYTATGIRRPVAKATVPSKPTVKSLATMILHALGDPRAAYGTEGNMTLRIMNLFKACEVEFLILDEIQHFVDGESSGRIMVNASNWLKTIIKETHMATVLVGLQGDAEQVVNVNPQLGRLFGDPYVLEPFTWDPSAPETITAFRKLLKALELQLPLAKPSHLYSPDTAQRCYVACGGVVGYLMRLIRGATRKALAQGREELNDGLLAAAFDASLAPERRGVPNPFIGTLPQVGGAKVQSRVRDLSATGNRSGAKKDRKERVKDVLA